MKIMTKPRLAVAALTLLAALGVAALPAAAATAADPAAPPDPSAVASAYLETRAAAVTADRPAKVLSRWAAPDSDLVANETVMARGAARRAGQLHHTIETVTCAVEILGVTSDEDGAAATVTAHAIVTTTWRAPSGELDTEASGIDHTLRLERIDNAWRVTADTYADVLAPNYLEAAGAAKAQVRRAARALEKNRPALSLPSSARSAKRSGSARRYRAIIKYDRPGAQAYADTWALSRNPTYVYFGSDCANFASQCANAGDMPQASGTWDTGWWYDKRSTSSPSDDRYSLSWINVAKQMDFWNGRRADWASSAGTLSRGDFIFYDWTGDGVWDHTAVVAGTNSAGQKVIDAHTTDHYRVFWKLGTSKTRYKYAQVRAQWVV